MNNDRRGFFGVLAGALASLLAGLFGKKSDPTIAHGGVAAAMSKLQFPNPPAHQIKEALGLKAASLDTAMGTAKKFDAEEIAEAIIRRFGNETPTEAIMVPFATLPLNMQLPKLVGDDAVFAPVRPLMQLSILDWNFSFEHGMWSIVSYIFNTTLSEVLAGCREHKTDWQVVDDAQLHDFRVPGGPTNWFEGGKIVTKQPPAAEVRRVLSPRFNVDVEELSRFTEGGLAKVLLAMGRGLAAEICGQMNRRAPASDWHVRTTPVQLYVKREAFLLEFFAWVNVAGWSEPSGDPSMGRLSQ